MINTKLIIILIGATVCSADINTVKPRVYTCAYDYSVSYVKTGHFYDTYKRNEKFNLNTKNNTDCFSKCYNMSDEQIELIIDNNYTIYDFNQFVREHMPNVLNHFCERNDICCKEIKHMKNKYFECFDNMTYMYHDSNPYPYSLYEEIVDYFGTCVVLIIVSIPCMVLLGKYFHFYTVVRIILTYNLLQYRPGLLLPYLFIWFYCYDTLLEVKKEQKKLD